MDAGVGYRLFLLKVKVVLATYRNPSSNAALANGNVYLKVTERTDNSVMSLNEAMYASPDRNVTANKSILYGVSAYLLSEKATLYTPVVFS